MTTSVNYRRCKQAWMRVAWFIRIHMANVYQSQDSLMCHNVHGTQCRHVPEYSTEQQVGYHTGTFKYSGLYYNYQTLSSFISWTHVVLLICFMTVETMCVCVICIYCGVDLGMSIAVKSILNQYTSSMSKLCCHDLSLVNIFLVFKYTLRNCQPLSRLPERPTL